MKYSNKNNVISGMSKEDKDGNSPFLKAVKNNNTELIELLMNIPIKIVLF